MDTVGRYEILHEIGRGGMATVYLARQADLGRLVALKELGVLRAGDGSLAHRFLREARMAGALSHPNVVTVHDYFEHGGTPYIAMEYVDGGSLRPHVEAPLSLAQVGGVLDGLLAGLAHAERHGIVHRDLKPENVLVTREGGVKITDFGIAKANDRILTAGSLTAVGTTLGTPAYMAPEQALGEAVSARTDLYAVGVIAFELLLGRTPFADTETPMGVLMRQVSDPIPAVGTIRPDVDPCISAWIERLLEKEPADRTPSAEVAREDLDETLDALLGSRWQRAAALPVLATAFVDAAPERPTPPTRRIGPTVPPVPQRFDPTVPLVPPRTLIPRPPAAAAMAAPVPTRPLPPPPAGRRWPRVAIALFALVAVLAALAAAAGKTLHASGTATPASSVPVQGSPAAASTQQAAPPAATAQPAAPAPAQPAAPVAPAPAAPVPPGENADDGGGGP